MNIQRSINKLLQEVYLPDGVHGGVKGRSNISNASVHCKCEILLNLDLKSYFPSISHHRVYGLFREELGCAPDIARILTKLCTVRGMVPQGANMSTDIANLVFVKTDKRLEAYLSPRNLKYTRFVDDISISGEDLKESQIDTIKSIIKDSGFTLNDDKEELRGRHENQTVTGLSTKYKFPRVTRQMKREWRRQRYLYNKFGEKAYNSKGKVKTNKHYDGWSIYVKSVEARGLGKGVDE